MNGPESACAHIGIAHVTLHHGNRTTSERWECEACGMRFVPQYAPSTEVQRTPGIAIQITPNTEVQHTPEASQYRLRRTRPCSCQHAPLSPDELRYRLAGRYRTLFVRAVKEADSMPHTRPMQFKQALDAALDALLDRAP